MENQMKRYVVPAALLIVTGLAATQITGPKREVENSTKTEPPTARPHGVPPQAVFRGGLDGGYFVTLVHQPLVLKNGRSLEAYKMGIYHAFSGDVEYRGNGLYVPPSNMSSDGEVYFFPPPPVDVILDSAYYSFGALEFPVEGSVELGRIVPLPLD